MAAKRYVYDDYTVIAEQPGLIAKKSGYFWFPKLHRLQETYLCVVAMTADKAQGYWSSGLYISEHKGAAWQFKQTLNYAHASTLLDSQHLLLLPYEVWPVSDQQKDRAEAEGQILIGSENTLRIKKTWVRFSGFPKPLADYAENQVCLLTNANIIARDNVSLTAVYGRFVDDEKFSLWCLVSDDKGLNWHYRSQILSAVDLAFSDEGASESCLLHLQNNDLLCICRVGSGKEYQYYKSYSSDFGCTWTKAGFMAEGIGSVAPQLLQLDNGLIILAGGRPGLFLWVCTDGQGAHWQQWDLSQHHNMMFENTSLPVFLEHEEFTQTTSYLSLVKLAGNQFLVCYDQLSNNWLPADQGSENSVFSVKITAELNKESKDE